MNKQAFLEGYMSKEARLNAPAKPSISSKAGQEAKRKEFVKRNMSRAKLPEKAKPYRGEPDIAVEAKMPKRKAIDKEAGLSDQLATVAGGAYGAAAGGVTGGVLGAAGNTLKHALTADEKKRKLKDYLKAALKGGAIGGGVGAVAGGVGGAVLGDRAANLLS